MKRFSWIIAVGIATASCSGHGTTSGILPSMSTTSHNGAVAGSGVGTTRMATAAAVAPSGWSTTNTQGISLTGATDLGALNAAQQVTVRVGLQLQNVSALQAALKAHQRLTRAQVAAQFDPSPAQVQQVETYLEGAGLSNVSVTADNLIVSATGTAAQVEKAFNTSLHSFSLAGKTVFANTTAAYVPSSLSGTVVAVLGLNNVAAIVAKPQKTAQSKNVTQCEEGVTVPCVRFYDPATFQAAYDVGSMPAATNTSIAIMAEGDTSQAIADLRTNEQEFNQPQVPVTVKQVGLASTDTSGDDEWTLDMTYSTAMAGNVQMVYVYQTTSLTDSDIALDFDKWMTDDLAVVANASFGECEAFAYADGSMVLDDEVLVQAAAQGQTLFASTGDNGGYCYGVENGVPGGVPMVEYPAASPYVVAVGGTDLLTNADGSYQGETAWEAGGGGLSQFEYAPYWEAYAQPVAEQGESFRGLPDVAMDGSIETGAELYTSEPAVNGSCTPCTTGGTSLSSPLAAGSYARMQSLANNTLGFAAIQFYTDYQTNPTATEDSTGLGAWEMIGGFHDILTGSNGLYTALPGYDMTTGLGSFDVSKVDAAI